MTARAVTLPEWLEALAYLTVAGVLFVLVVVFFLPLFIWWLITCDWPIDDEEDVW